MNIFHHSAAFLAKHKKHHHLIIALLVVLVAGAGGVSLYKKIAKAATFTFTQSSWTGGATANTATHAVNQGGWAEYATSTGVTAGSTVVLPASSYTFTDDGATSTTSTIPTAGGTFGAGTNSSTTVSGSGVGASVGLAAISASPGFYQVSAGDTHSCGLKNDGSVYCWGNNDSGQLGDNTTVAKSVPVQVLGVGGTGTLANIVSINVGSLHVCAVSSSGSAYCWGANDSGQLGDNTTVAKSVPV
ncbi:MAG: hypothetical protein AAB497_01830, partial [Patescibacteria group bacterium]